MSIGQYIIGGLIGLGFGVAAASLSAWLTVHGLKSEKKAGVMGVTLLRQIIDIATLFIVFLLRKVLPFHPYALLIGTALGLSAGGILLAVRTGKKLEKDQ